MGMSISFTKRLHPGIAAGVIDCSIRIWKYPRVKVGARAPLGLGHVEVTAVTEIPRKAITNKLARRSGFKDVEDLMKVAQHGSGDRVFLVEFIYEE